MNVVDRLQRLRPDAFDVPEMEEFVRHHSFQLVVVFTQRGSRDANGRSIAVFHAAGGSAFAREMQNKRIAVEREGPASASDSSVVIF